MNVEEFILGSIERVENSLNEIINLRELDPDLYWTVRDQLNFQRQVVEWHKNWPVLVETRPTFDKVSDSFETVRYKMQQQMQWVAQEEYVNRFGREAPTAPLMKKLATMYSHMPNFKEEWRAE